MSNKKKSKRRNSRKSNYKRRSKNRTTPIRKIVKKTKTKRSQRSSLPINPINNLTHSLNYINNEKRWQNLPASVPKKKRIYVNDEKISINFLNR